MNEPDLEVLRRDLEQAILIEDMIARQLEVARSSPKR
jgi:hypothetical protein